MIEPRQYPTRTDEIAGLDELGSVEELVEK